ncbi:MAG: polyprenyl synthetase family protein [bacterium]|nr:polyprenyl synthetase family protein [bacterium]
MSSSQLSTASCTFPNPRYAEAIATRLQSLLEEAAQRWQDVGSWATDVLPRLADFACRGKLLRGQLVLIGAAAAGSRPSRVLLDCAAALELFHTSVLIHDDVIDQDQLRRGLPAMHVQLASALRARGERLRADTHGTALAICAADCGFFLSFSILAQLRVPESVRRALLKLWSEEFAHVILAQMDDVHLSPGTTPAPREAIWRVYLYKTARYTFCLPLMTGLLVAGAPAALRRSLMAYAEQLGLLFQLKDDELGLFGSSAETGKPVGSDILQNKKTLYHHYLLTCTSPEIRAKIEQLFGAPQLHTHDIAFIRRVLRDTGIYATLRATASHLATRARRIATRLPVPPRVRAQLLQLVDFSEARSA